MGVRRRALGVLVAAAAVVGGVVAFVQPSAVAAGGPGTLVSSTPLTGGQLPAGAGSGHRILYTSTGVGGAATDVSGLVYLPKGTPPSGGWRVLSWAHGTTGLGDQCAPSATGPLGYLSGWLDAGYAVVATDYAGLGTPGGHPYLDGKVSAYGVIDAVRAGRELDPGLSAHWFVAGQSQGGHAAMFTGHEAAAYAPELDFRGTVGHGVPSNLSYFVSLIGPTFPPSLIGTGTKTLVAFILAGMRTAVPGFDLDSYLTPLGKDVVGQADALCNGDLATLMARTNLADLFTKDLGPAFQQAWGSVFDVPVTGYDKPVFIAQGAQDSTVPPSLTSQLVTALQQNNQPLTFKSYQSDHGGTPGAALADALAFADTLFAGITDPTTTPTTPPTTTPPVPGPTDVKVTADRAPDAGGWYRAPFTAKWSATAAAGIASCTTTPYPGPDTATGSLSGTCTDNNGRSADAAFAFKYDATAPTATVVSGGFLRSGATVSGAAADATSGVRGATVTFADLLGKRVTRPAVCGTDCTTWTAPTTGLRGIYLVSASASDAAGNTGSASPAKVVLLL